MTDLDPLIDFNDLFDYQSFISITSSGGHIGRLVWCNQRKYTIEVYDNNNKLVESDTTELHGSIALISTMGDWYAWMFGD